MSSIEKVHKSELAVGDYVANSVPDTMTEDEANAKWPNADELYWSQVTHVNGGIESTSFDGHREYDPTPYAFRLVFD